MIQRSFLRHIIKGDSSDGIPNLLSDDDALSMKAKDKTLWGEKVKAIMESLDTWFEASNWERN